MAAFGDVGVRFGGFDPWVGDFVFIEVDFSVGDVLV